MKGVVFTEFMELVEDKFSFETADKIVEGSDLASGGAYTSLGTYDHEELLKMVTLLSEMSDAPIPDLVRTFGLHLANRFAAAFPQFFENTDYFWKAWMVTFTLRFANSTPMPSFPNSTPNASMKTSWSCTTVRPDRLRIWRMGWCWELPSTLAKRWTSIIRTRRQSTRRERRPRLRSHASNRVLVLTD